MEWNQIKEWLDYGVLGTIAVLFAILYLKERMVTRRLEKMLYNVNKDHTEKVEALLRELLAGRK